MSKEQILEIAERQMKLGGYESLSFRVIAEELGISKANVHHHFKTKAALAKEVSNHYAKIHLTEIEALAQSYSPDYVAFIGALEEMFWRHSKEADNCGVCVFAQITREASAPRDLLDFAQKHFEQILGIFLSYAQLAMDAGKIRSDLTADIVAIQTGVMMNGMMAMAQGMPSVEAAHQLLKGQATIWAKSLK
jgi:TetR/AcrR family transcriptional regulator, transcriptional repressor for nem operon